VKGYQFEKGRYVVLSEEDFDKVRPESTRVIDLVQFTDESAIDPPAASLAPRSVHLTWLLILTFWA
jgi:non-homologous end joining protein Ku